jgi:hypothetical protein
VVGANGAESPVAAPHTAPHDEIIAIVRELIQRSPAQAVSIDTLANALKSRGFSRTPGSPRLITRLRRIKEIAVSRTGMITLLDSARGDSRDVPPETAPAPAASIGTPAVRFETLDEDADLPGPHEAPDEPAETPAARVAAASDYDEIEEPGDSIGNVAPPVEPVPAQRYRRPYRGDRRRFPRPQRASV